MTPQLAVSDTAPTCRELLKRQLVLDDRGRSMGLLAIAPRGAGKSRMLGRFVAWQDFLRGVPLVLWDPTGGMIANFLDKLMRQPPAVQAQLWRRVRYVDLAATHGRVIPLPLLARRSGESLYAVSQRFPDLVRRTDPALASAPVLGWNAFHPLATAAGVVLAALELQLTEAPGLVTNPAGWRPVFTDPRLQSAEAQPAVAHLSEQFLALPERERVQRAEALITKLGLLSWDPVSRAMYGASAPGLDWQAIEDEQLAVLLDFSGLHDVGRLQFGMLWLFRSFVDWLRRRGTGFHHTPISLVIDELTAMIGPAGANHDLLAADFEEVIARLSRSHKLWLTVAFQELVQMPERIAAILLTLGNQLFGATSDVETALRLAKRYHRYDPYQIKKTEPVYNSYLGIPEIIDYRTIEFTMEEQEYLASLAFLDLPRYHFLVGSAPHEGRLPTQLAPMTIARYDAGQFPDDALVDRARHLLSERDGQLVADVLAEIGRRQDRLAGDHGSTPVLSMSPPRQTRRRVDLAAAPARETTIP